MPYAQRSSRNVRTKGDMASRADRFFANHEVTRHVSAKSRKKLVSDLDKHMK